MMNGTRAINPVDLLKELFEVVSEDNLQRIFAIPMANALDEFSWDHAEPFSYTLFLETLSGFVKFIYQNAWVPTQEMTQEQARAEAMHLLHRYDQGDQARGFEAAYLDAQNENHRGLQFVLTQVTRVMSQQAQQNYLRCFFQTHVNNLDWSSRKELAGLLLERIRAVKPQILDGMTSSQFADECPELVKLIVQSKEMAWDALSTRRNFFRTETKQSKPALFRRS